MTQTNHSMVAAPKSAPTIHPEGLYRWDEFADRIPFSRETWRKRVLAGQAPAAKLVSRACTAWKGEDILAWLNNPDSYK